MWLSLHTHSLSSVLQPTVLVAIVIRSSNLAMCLSACLSVCLFVLSSLLGHCFSDCSYVFLCRYFVAKETEGKRVSLRAMLSLCVCTWMCACVRACVRCTPTMFWVVHYASRQLRQASLQISLASCLFFLLIDWPSCP